MSVGRSLLASLTAGTLLLLSVGTRTAAAADVIELLSGAKVEGAVSKIDRESKQVTITRTLGSRTYNTTYPYSKIHAVTMGGKRYVLTEKTDQPAADTPTPRPSERTPRKPSAGETRSRAEVQALIDEQGQTPPDWFEATPLVYPKTLDLAWPEPAPKGWENQKNIGQYIWDVINPNPGKWKEGTRFLHHLLSLHEDQPELRLRIMNTLGRFYFDLLQDYPRAAFWWQKAGVGKSDDRFVHAAPHLALCYWRLGCKPMAVELLEKIERTVGSLQIIKAWGDMGETKRALQLAESYIRGSKPDMHAPVYLQAGDACRTNGQYAQAIQYYQKALDVRVPDETKPHVVRQREHARENIDAIKLFELCDPTKVPDGVYEASCMGYEAQVHVAVTVKSGRIEAVEVKRHSEKQFYSSMIDTPAKIIKRQSVKGIDATSGATLTSEAIINATAKALVAAAKK